MVEADNSERAEESLGTGGPSDRADRPVIRSEAPRADTGVLLRVVGVTKTFPGTVALDHVDFDVRAGEIHALVGENGAGKSTLIKILSGLYSPEDGSILCKGEPYNPSSDRIAFIHQDLGLFAQYSVAENIALVAGYPMRRRLISWQDTNSRAERILSSMGSNIDPEEIVQNLTSADCSIVAIARALAVDADVLVLDEPTASLPESDVGRLFGILAELRDRGHGIVFVSHRLDEVFRIADRVTVLRDGRRILTERVCDTTPGRLVFDIVGRELSAMFLDPVPPRSEVALELKDLMVGSVGPVNLQLQQGEVVGLVGLRGAGHSLVGRSIFGDAAGSSATGLVKVGGVVVRNHAPAQAMRAGVAFVSSKRAEEGIAGSLTVQENVFPDPAGSARSRFGGIRPKRERELAGQVLARYDVRPRDPLRAAGTLSGGNQQKVLLARWLERRSEVLVLEDPTFGVDVGAKVEIYRILAEQLAFGRGILLVSSDFEEVAGICHRAFVFRRGRVIAEVPRRELSTARLTELASGADTCAGPHGVPA